MSKVAVPNDIYPTYQDPKMKGITGYTKKVGQILRSPECLLGACSILILTAISAASLNHNQKAQEYTQIFNNQINELQQSLQNTFHSSLSSISSFYNNFNATQANEYLQETLSTNFNTITTFFDFTLKSTVASLPKFENLNPFQSKETEILEANMLSDNALAALNVRKENPAEYVSSFVTQFFGHSAIGATATLAAALGEAPKSFLEACKGTITGSWCNLSHLNEYFRDQPEKKPNIARAVSDAYDSEYLSLDPDNQQRFQYRTPPYKQNELTRTDRMATLEGSKRHLTRSDWRVQLSDEANTLSISRAVRDYPHGERKSRWENYILSCTKTRDTIECKTDLPLDHKKGSLDYLITERKVSDNCSIVKETLTFPNNVIENQYALNPKDQLPYFLPHFLNSERLVKNLQQISSLNNWWTGNIDAKFIAPTQFPKDLPTTCEELKN